MRAARILAVAPLALATAACGGTQGSGSGASDLVPASAPVYIALDTNPDWSQWKTVEALASRFPDMAKGETNLEQSLRNDAGLDWENGVKPALGDEVAL